MSKKTDEKENEKQEVGDNLRAYVLNFFPKLANCQVY